MTVRQYSSMLAVERVANLENLARARQQRPKRRGDVDMYLQEDFVRVRTEGEDTGDRVEVDPMEDLTAQRLRAPGRFSRRCTSDRRTMR